MGGVGRSATVAACLLVAKGVAADEAIARARRARPSAIETVEQERFVRSFHMDPDPPLGLRLRHRLPAYAGALVFDGDRALLRRLDAHGYRWTFPRRRVSSTTWDEELIVAIQLAAESVAIRSQRPIPGTWEGAASVGQYWLFEGAAETTLTLAPDLVAEARAAFGGEPTEAALDVVRRLRAGGLPIDKVGVPLPLSPEHRALVWQLASSLPEPPPPPDALQLEWVRVDEVADRLAQTTCAVGRARDLAVWRLALELRDVKKPLMSEVANTSTFQIELGGEVVDIDPHTFNADAGPVSLPCCRDPETMAFPNAVHQAVFDAGGALRACTTCRHARRTLMSSTHCGVWCWATRDPDDDRRSTSDAMALCPLWEPSLLLWGLRADDRGQTDPS
jgi:hypothetical protein